MLPQITAEFRRSRRRQAGPDSTTQPIRLAILVTHPIQYFSPLYRYLAQQPDIDLTVFYRSCAGAISTFDPGFNREITWDVPLLDGYRHEFLPALGGSDRVSLYRPFTYGIATRLWRGRFDVLWVHGYAPWINWVAMLAARAAGTAVLVRDEATPISLARSPVKSSLKRLFFALLGRICDGFLAISTLNRRYYLENGIPADRIFLVPYTVDNAYFAELARAAAPRRDELRAELGLEPGRPVVLYASKFQRRKRAGDLLAAFATAMGRARPGQNAYLLFVGDGEMRGELESVARPLGDRVRFLGFRNQSGLPRFFDLCDVFVLPSEHEPFGLIVNEVMAAGRAVIVSDQVGCGPDLVENGVNGYVYPVGHVESLAKALEAVLWSPDRSKAMGRAGAERIAGWGFQQDLNGFRAAMAAITHRRTAEQAPSRR